MNEYDKNKGYKLHFDEIEASRLDLKFIKECVSNNSSIVFDLLASFHGIVVSFIISKTCFSYSSLVFKSKTIYFCRESSQFNYTDDVESTIGVSSCDDFAIKGFPTLAIINNAKVAQNIAGVSSIKTALNIK